MSKSSTDPAQEPQLRDLGLDRLRRGLRRARSEPVQSSAAQRLVDDHQPVEL
jgi:hypothetical protein